MALAVADKPKKPFKNFPPSPSHKAQPIPPLPLYVIPSSAFEAIPKKRHAKPQSLEAPSDPKPSLKPAQANEPVPAKRDAPVISYKPAPYKAPAPSYKPAPKPTYSRPTYKEPEYKSDAKYSYGYEVKAKSYSRDVNFGHSENRDGCSTSGSYSVLLPDGRVQTVTYTVDCYAGYNAQVSYSGVARPYSYKPAPKYKPAPSYKPVSSYKPAKKA